MVVGAQRGITSTNLVDSNWVVSQTVALGNDLIDDVPVLCHFNDRSVIITKFIPRQLTTIILFIIIYF